MRHLPTGAQIGAPHDMSLLPIAKPMTTAPMNSTRKMPNNHCAMVVAACAMSVKPKKAATRAMIRKTKAHLSIGAPPR